MITIGQIDEYMKSGKIFSLVAITYDCRRKKGGKLLEIHEGRLVQNNPEGQQLKARRAATYVEVLQETLRKNPQHHQHYTRNIQILVNGYPTDVIKKIHPPLIIQFNGDSEVVP